MNILIENWESKIAYYTQLINEFRQKCQHKDFTINYCGSTGNMDENKYWQEYRCKECGKFWTEKY